MFILNGCGLPPSERAIPSASSHDMDQQGREFIEGLGWDLAQEVEVVVGGVDGHVGDAQRGALGEQAPPPSLVETLFQQVQHGLMQRDRTFAKEIYCKHSQGLDLLPKSKLIHALNEVGVKLELGEINEVLMESGSDLDFDQFSQLAMRLRKSNEWSGLLLLHELLADSLPKRDGEHPLQVMSQLSAAEISAVCDAFSCGLKVLLQKASDDLKNAFQKVDQIQELESTGNEEERFNMVSEALDDCGSSPKSEVEELNEHMGHLQILLALDSKILFNKMLAEHNDTSPFTLNGTEYTTPKAEWDIVMCGDSSKNHDGKGRKIPKLDSVLKEDAANGLLREEVIAMVLYTGKMFSRYNCVQRRWPTKDYTELLASETLYSTTICVLISAVIKVAQQVRTEKVMALYRGVGMSCNPKYLWSPSIKHNPTEKCVMSTTKDQKLAIKFSGLWKRKSGDKGKSWPTIFEIDTGSVELGADITSFSQYPGQKEVLFPPFLDLQPVGMEQIDIVADMVVSKVRVNVHLNVDHRLQSLENPSQEKMHMFIAQFEYLIDELEKELFLLANLL